MNKKKLLAKVPAEAEVAVLAQFPELGKIIDHDHDPAIRFVAISIFDHWIDDEQEFYLLEKCEGDERASRDKKFKLLWAKIFDEATVLTWRNRGRPPKKSKISIRKFLNKSGYLNRCAVDTWNAPSMFIILPEYGAIYVESWDETNYLYYQERTRIAPILEWAVNCGLHILDPR